MSTIESIDIQALLATLEKSTSEEDLQAFHAAHLGKKWSITQLFKQMWSIPAEEKKAYGQRVQEIMQTIQEAFNAKQLSVKQALWNDQLKSDLVDVSLPPLETKQWYLTLLAQARRRVEEIFQGMGFSVETGNHMVPMFDNFISLNIPESHPATEMHDTLYVDTHDETWKNLVMRTHTTAHDNETIKKLGVPCKFINVWKVYRNEKMDASHDCVFWQIDWVYIDKNISLAHFKNMMRKILVAILEDDSIEMRMRPWYFPFVEPGLEIDAFYQLKDKAEWLEILWAWMLHPNVLEMAGIDSNEYTGFAFGIGLTRLIAIKYGIKDIRLLTNADMRFVQSF